MNIRGELMASLTLMNFDGQEDSGIYEVRAGNAFGEVTHIFQIQEVGTTSSNTMMMIG